MVSSRNALLRIGNFYEEEDMILLWAILGGEEDGRRSSIHLSADNANVRINASIRQFEQENRGEAWRDVN